MFRATLEINKFLYEGIKKLARVNNKNIGDFFNIIICEFLENNQEIFTKEEKIYFEKIKNKIGGNK